MQIAFTSLRTRLVCENEDIAAEELGLEVAFKLKNRLADIAAARNVAVIWFGNPVLIDIDGVAKGTIELIDSYKISFTVNHKTIPRDEAGNVNWGAVTYIKIVQIFAS